MEAYSLRIGLGELGQSANDTVCQESLWNTTPNIQLLLPPPLVIRISTQKLTAFCVPQFPYDTKFQEHDFYTQYMYTMDLFHLYSIVTLPYSPHSDRMSLPFFLGPNFLQQVLMFFQQLLRRSYIHTHFLTAHLLPNSFRPQQEPATVLQEGLLILGLLQNVLLLLGLHLEFCQKPLHVLHLLSDGPALCRVSVLNPTRRNKIHSIRQTNASRI